MRMKDIDEYLCKVANQIHFNVVMIKGVQDILFMNQIEKELKNANKSMEKKNNGI